MAAFVAAGMAITALGIYGAGPGILGFGPNSDGLESSRRDALASLTWWTRVPVGLESPEQSSVPESVPQEVKKDSPTITAHQPLSRSVSRRAARARPFLKLKRQRTLAEPQQQTLPVSQATLAAAPSEASANELLQMQSVHQAFRRTFLAAVVKPVAPTEQLAIVTTQASTTKAEPPVVSTQNEVSEPVAAETPPEAPQGEVPGEVVSVAPETALSTGPEAHLKQEESSNAVWDRITAAGEAGAEPSSVTTQLQAQRLDDLREWLSRSDAQTQWKKEVEEAVQEQAAPKVAAGAESPGRMREQVTPSSRVQRAQEISTEPKRVVTEKAQAPAQGAAAPGYSKMAEALMAYSMSTQATSGNRERSAAPAILVAKVAPQAQPLPPLPPLHVDPPAPTVPESPVVSESPVVEEPSRATEVASLAEDSVSDSGAEAVEAFAWDQPLSGVQTETLADDGLKGSAWKLYRAADHWPTLTREDRAVPLLSRNPAKILARAAGTELQEQAGLVLVHLPRGWTAELSSRSEGPVLLSAQGHPVPAEQVAEDRYAVFLNVAPGFALLSLKGQFGKSQLSVGVPAMEGVLTYLNLSQPEKVSLRGRVLNATSADARAVPGTQVRVVGQPGAQALSDAEGQFSIEGVWKIGTEPLYLETHSESGHPHRYKISAESVTSELQLFRFRAKDLTRWVRQLEGGLSPLSGLVVGALPGPVARSAARDAAVFPSVRVLQGPAAIQPETYTVATNESLQINMALSPAAPRFLAVQVPEGGVIAEAHDQRGLRVWSELLPASPGVVNVIISP